jgi:hypothetical protein
MLSERRPPSEWDDDMQLDEVIELDDHELDVKLDDHDLDYLMMPREEGEGFYEAMENRLADLDIDEACEAIIDEIGPEDETPYDDEDVYVGGDEWPDEDYDWPSDSDSYEEEAY